MDGPCIDADPGILLLQLALLVVVGIVRVCHSADFKPH